MKSGERKISRTEKVMRALDQAQKVAVESGRGTIQAVDVELFLEEMIESIVENNWTPGEGVADPVLLEHIRLLDDARSIVRDWAP